MDSENLSSLIRLSVSDGQKTDSSKVVSIYKYIIKCALNGILWSKLTTPPGRLKTFCKGFVMGYIK